MQTRAERLWKHLLMTAMSTTLAYAVLQGAVIDAPAAAIEPRAGREWAGQLVELSAPERAELLQSREGVWRAWFAGDEAKLLAVLPPETIALAAGPDGWSTRPEIVKSSLEFARGGGKLVSLTFPRTEMQVYGATAILYTSYAFETDTAGKRSGERGKAIEVFVRRGDAWLNSGWQVMPDPPESR